MHGTLALIVLVVLLVLAYKAGIRKNSSNVVIGGVCSGIANHIGLTPALVRVIAFVACVATGGFITLLYIGLWITLPKS